MLNRKFEIVSKIFTIISIIAATIFLSTDLRPKWMLVGIISSGLLAIIIVLKYHFLIKTIFDIKQDVKTKIMVVLISLYVGKIYLGYFDINYLLIAKLFGLGYTQSIKRLIGLIALPAIFECLYLMIRYALDFGQKIYKTMDKTDKAFVAGVMIVAAIGTMVIYSVTSAFDRGISIYDTAKRGGQCDVFFHTDSAYIGTDAFWRFSMIENDIRNPFFAVFSLPFSMLSMMLSDYLFFIPRAYDVALNVMQLGLLALSIVMMAQMLGLSATNKKLFYWFMSCSFVYVMFAFIREQYIFSVFFAMAAIYWFVKYKNKTNFWFVAAAGSMITSGVLLPLICKTRDLKTWLESFKNVSLVVLTVAVISGQFKVIVKGLDRSKVLLSTYGGAGISFFDKFKQFLYFIRSIFVSPRAVTIDHGNYHSYQLPIINYISWMGLALLIVALAGTWMFRKNLFVRICAIWMLFASIILLIIGWGAKENSMLLYGLYFGFGFLVPVFMVMVRFNKSLLFYSILAIMTIVNIKGFVGMMQFALQYYPA